MLPGYLCLDLFTAQPGERVGNEREFKHLTHPSEIINSKQKLVPNDSWSLSGWKYILLINTKYPLMNLNSTTILYFLNEKEGKNLSMALLNIKEINI